MPFDAGSIQGKIDLNIVSFKDGMSEAHTHAETEGGRMREVFETIAESLNEAVGPALGQVGNQLQSVFAGFSEGGVIGSLNAVGVAAGIVREMVAGVGEDFGKTALEAEKLGVPVEWFSRMAEVGKTAQIAPEQLTLGFTMLTRQAYDFANGSKEAGKGFEQIGITASELNKHLGDTKWIIEEVFEGMGKLHTQGERLSAAHELVGRTGSALIPIFAMTKEQIQSVADTMDVLGGVMHDNDAVLGHDWDFLTTAAGALGDGIERAFARPILQEFHNNLGAIKDLMKSIADEAPIIVHGFADAAKDLKFLLDNAGKANIPGSQGGGDAGGMIWNIFHDTLPHVTDDVTGAYNWIKEKDAQGWISAAHQGAISDLGYNPAGGALSGVVIGDPLHGGYRLAPQYAVAPMPANLMPHYTYHSPTSGNAGAALPPVTINLQMDTARSDVGEISYLISSKLKQVWDQIQGQNQQKAIQQNMMGGQ